MINSIKGNIILVKDNYIIVDNNNIGYKIYIQNSWILDLQNEIITQTEEEKKIREYFFWIYQSVRENSLELYGFKTFSQLEIFELLISISGIGPKVALSIMNVSTPASLKRAVLTENLDELIKVSGIGKKNAQKIILELKNKIEKIKLEKDEEKNLGNDLDIETFETLEALGFSKNKIRYALQEIESKNSSKILKDKNLKLKEALKILGSKK